MIYGTLWCGSNHPVCLSERLGTYDALLCVSHALQSALQSGQEARIVQIDFSAAFDRVNHQGSLYRLSSVGNWVSVVLCCLYLRSSYLIDHSLLWWMDVAVNWSTVCQECRRAVFWARCCSFCTPRNFFPFWRISLLVMLTTKL